MPGDDLGPATDHHPVHVAPHQHVSVSEGHRRRVVVGLVPDQGQGTHPASLLLAGVICHRRQRQQGIQVPLHPLPDALRMSPEPGVHPFQASSLQVGIQGIKALEGRDGRQEIAPRVAHQALHLTLVIALAGAAEPVIEQVVGLELGEGPGALAPTVAQDPGNSQPGIVVEDALRHSPQESEGRQHGRPGRPRWSPRDML